MAGHRVVEGTQVHLDGVTYVSGEKLPADVDQETLDRWLASERVTEVTTVPQGRPKRGQEGRVTA